MKIKRISDGKVFNVYGVTKTGWEFLIWDGGTGDNWEWTWVAFEEFEPFDCPLYDGR